MNKSPIDIVIPWVNPMDESWQKTFNEYSKKERGLTHAGRYNDWGMIRYVLRSIEQNCNWCRYVFLVLSDERQIPPWLNLSCPKLKIVYHRDFIPNEFLPTFNSSVIELHFCKIKELANNYVLCNDDTFFWNKTDENYWFVNDEPVMNSTKTLTYPTYLWGKNVNNGLKFINEIFETNERFIPDTLHMPVGYAKLLQMFFWSKYADKLNESMSRFRTEKNFTHTLFSIFQERFGHCVLRNKVNDSFYCGIRDRLPSIPEHIKLCCLNETETSTAKGMTLCVDAVTKRFNKKSNFEI